MTAIRPAIGVVAPFTDASFGVWNQQAARALRRVLAGCEPDETIVHVHGWAKALSPSIGPVLERANLKCVFTMHEYFIACPNGGFYDYPGEHICHLRAMSPACISRNCDARSYQRKLMRVGRHALMQRTGLLDCIERATGPVYSDAAVAAPLRDGRFPPLCRLWHPGASPGFQAARAGWGSRRERPLRGRAAMCWYYLELISQR